MPGPVTVEIAKQRLGIRTSLRDAEIASLIEAAVGQVETESGCLLTRRSHKIKGTRWRDGEPVKLYVRPVHEVLSVTYRTRSGGGEIADPLLIGSALFPPGYQSWPADTVQYEVEVEAGFDEGEVPPQLVQAVLMLVGHWFENHEAVVVGTVTKEIELGFRDLVRHFNDDPGIS